MLEQVDQVEGSTKEHVVSLPMGLRVRTLEAGTGPTVLLLHGNPDNADEWKPLMGLLKSHFRCIAPDLPGYGRRAGTYALPDNYNYSREAQILFVDTMLAQLNIEGPITLVVHDIGGIMGVPWAARHLERLTSMIFTNTVVFPHFKWFSLAYRWGQDDPVGRFGANMSIQALGWFRGWLFRRVFAQQHPQLSRPEVDRFVRDFALNPIAKQTTLREFRQITKPAFFDGYDRLLHTITAAVPTVTVWGAGDPYVPDRFANELPTPQTLVLPGVGHWVPIVAADSLAEQILARRVEL